MKNARRAGARITRRARRFYGKKKIYNRKLVAYAITKMKKILTAIGLTVLAPFSVAQEWQTLEKTPTMVIAYQPASIKPIGNMELSVTWRYGEPDGQYFLGYSAAVNCIDMSYRRVSSWSENGRTGQIRTDPPGKSIVTFPGLQGSEGKVMVRACSTFLPDWEKVWDFSAAQDCANPRLKMDKFLCEKDADTNRSYDFFAYRFEQAIEACGASEDDRKTVMSLIYYKIEDCTSGRCAASIFSNQSRTLGNDLELKRGGQQCLGIGKLLAEAREQIGRERAATKIQEYWSCFRRAASYLDDRISSAETIASATHSKCRPEFGAAMRESEAMSRASGQLEASIKPKQIEIILDGRANRRQADQPKKKPAPQS